MGFDKRVFQDMTVIPYAGRFTVHKGVRMRSRLEAATAAAFDRGHVEWEYEPCAFQAADGRQYLPDFRVVVPLHSNPLEDAREVVAYVEVKPDVKRMADVANSEVMRCIWLSDSAAFLVVTSPTDWGVVVTGPQSGKTFPFTWSACDVCKQLFLIASERLGFKCHGGALRSTPLLPLDYSKAV